MNQTTNLRNLRLRHNITLIELARAAGVSLQQISRVELLERAPTRELENKYEDAMEKVIVKRYDDVRSLERDYRAVKGILLRKREE